MSYEYVSRARKDSSESVRVMEALTSRGLKPVAVVWKPETGSVVIHFDAVLTPEDKERVDKVMRALGYMVG